MSYALRIEKQAGKTIKVLDRLMVKRILHRLEELSQDPFNPRISSQVGMAQGERKSRVGDWRIFYEVDEDTHIVNIIAVRPRDKAYRKS